MTLPFERTNAVKNTERFLMDLCDPKKTPRIPKEIRRRAGSLLKHYPCQFHMDIVSEREDEITNEQLKSKKQFYQQQVFGKKF